MDKKEVIQKIFDEISATIETNGFKTDLKNQWFVRETKETIDIFDIHFYNRTNIKTGAKGFLIEPYIWINVKEISEYYKEITLNKELKRSTDFKILGEKVAEIIANPSDIHKKWNESLNLIVFEENEIRNVTKILLKKFEKIALPYFTKYGSVKMVDKIANNQPRENIVHLSNDTHRIIHGLIAAKLNGNPQLRQLLETYESLIFERNMPKDCKMEMDRLKAVLPLIGEKLI